jgi:hypothetical protein
MSGGGGEIRTRVPEIRDQGFRDLADKPLLHPTMVCPRRFERPTSSSAGMRSIQLSYGHIFI